MPKKINIRKGHCQRCGKCCESKTLLGDMSLCEKIFLWIYLRLIKKVKYKDINCPYLIFINGFAICKQYEKRPWFCKEYPNIKQDLIKNCGYRF